MIIYEFLKNILHNEYKNIFQKNTENNTNIVKDKKKKIRKKNIIVNIDNADNTDNVD
jgi:hypothetical protein